MTATDWADPRFLFTIAAFVLGSVANYAVLVFRVGKVENTMKDVGKDVKGLLSRVSNIEGYMSSAAGMHAINSNRPFGRRQDPDDTNI